MKGKQIVNVLTSKKLDTIIAENTFIVIVIGYCILIN